LKRKHHGNDKNKDEKRSKNQLEAPSRWRERAVPARKGPQLHHLLRSNFWPRAFTEKAKSTVSVKADEGWRMKTSETGALFEKENHMTTATKTPAIDMASKVRPGCHWQRDGVNMLTIRNKRGKSFGSSLFIHYREGGFTVGARMSHAEALALENEAKNLWKTLP
jgi:hypothetical protein